ncbi:MAG: 50S ribosomal protein L16 [bacterium]|nr:50S ribosomal protein L16 [bacterium]
MLIPSKFKFRKHHRPIVKGIAHKGNKVVFGDYGLKATENGWITEKQIEACRLTIVRAMNKGKLWIRVFPDKPISRKPLETRMGKGKGEPAFYVAPVKAGRVLFEVSGVDEEDARRIFRVVSYKLPVATAFIKKDAAS